MTYIYFGNPSSSTFPFVETIAPPFFPVANFVIIDLFKQYLKEPIQTVLLQKSIYGHEKEKIFNYAKEHNICVELIDNSDSRLKDVLNGFNVPLKPVSIDDLRTATDREVVYPLRFPWDFINLHEMQIKNMRVIQKGEIEKNVSIKGKIILEEGAIIRSGAYVEGPVILAKNAIAGPNCYLRSGTYLGPNTFVGNACEIKNSIILEGTHIGHLSYVGDSIIGRNCNFGAGTIVANLNFDNKPVNAFLDGQRIQTGRRKIGVFMGDNTKTSINASIMPGTIIPANSLLLIEDRFTSNSKNIKTLPHTKATD